MLTRMWQLTLFSIFLSLSIPANSKNITKSDIISAALPFIKQGLNEAPLKCLGISKAELDLTFEQANLTCQSNVPKLMPQHEFEQHVSTFSNCVTAGVQQSFDVSDEQVQRCESNAEISYTNSINGDFDDPQAYLERIANKVNKALIQHAQLSNTENIPLPLYPNHKVISHFPDGMGALSEKESLPVLVIASNTIPKI
ncbi:MAG: hypothetical protein HAW66_05015 [Shewanella sp.]|nr:hypothetical protein [Shewanella sp.]